MIIIYIEINPLKINIILFQNNNKITLWFKSQQNNTV